MEAGRDRSRLARAGRAGRLTEFRVFAGVSPESGNLDDDIRLILSFLGPVWGVYSYFHELGPLPCRTPRFQHLHQVAKGLSFLIFVGFAENLRRIWGESEKWGKDLLDLGVYYTTGVRLGMSRFRFFCFFHSAFVLFFFVNHRGSYPQ